MVLDEEALSEADAAARAELERAADARGVRVHRVTVDDGPDVARFASLLATGRFAAIYLALGQAS